MKKIFKPQGRDVWSCRLDSPLGELCLTFTPRGLAALSFAGAADPSPPGGDPPSSLSAMFDTALKELEDYFAGRPTPFQSVCLDLQGTPFQLRVWSELRRIPGGTTIFYQDLATRLGNHRAPRAVGQALRANPIPIIIPCHRVIAKDGSLGGYSSGLTRKRWLLRHEGVMV